MNCNSQIHDELKNMMELTCPFCSQQLLEVDKAIESCCSEQNVENIDGMNTCLNCGLIHCCDDIAEYFNFYENMYMLRRKSIYHRKYRINYVLDCISCENNVQLTYRQKERIHEVFIEIGSVLHDVDDGRKRIICIKYVIKQLFKMIGLPYKDINITKSKRTLKFYNEYWEKILLLIGDRIQSIINK